MTVQQDRALRQLAACYTPLMGTHQWSCDGVARRSISQTRARIGIAPPAATRNGGSGPRPPRTNCCLWRKGLKWIDLSREQIEQLLEEVSTKFPELFLKALCKEYDQGKLAFDNEPKLEGLECPAAFTTWLQPVSDIPWIIRCPQVWDRRGMKYDPDATAKTVEYLAKYANRVAVSNNRLVGIEGSKVLLRYKDYRDNDTWKTKPIDGVEFIGRFLRHLLPPKMHHIRRYGWMARRAKNEKLTWLRDRFDIPALDSDEDDQATDEEDDQSQTIPEAPSRPCRYCQGQGEGEIQGKMYLTSWPNQLFRKPTSRPVRSRYVCVSCFLVSNDMNASLAASKTVTSPLIPPSESRFVIDGHSSRPMTLSWHLQRSLYKFH